MSRVHLVFLGNISIIQIYIKSEYYSICDDNGVDANEAWMHGDWFYRTDYAIFGHEVKATGRSHSQMVLQKKALKR